MLADARPLDERGEDRHSGDGAGLRAIQGKSDMKDIKELVLKVAKEMNWRMDEMTLETFATRLIAAYCEGQEQVAWDGAEEWEQLAWNLCAEEGGEESCIELLWDGGPIPEPWGDRWLKYEGEAKRMISLVRKFTAPPEPTQAVESAIAQLVTALQQSKGWMRDYADSIIRDAIDRKTAPSSEEVQRMIGWLRVELGHLVTCQQAADMIERLAARVPDGCVVVPMGPTDVEIAAGEVKP